MASSAAFLVSLLTLAIPQPPPAPPLEGLGAPPPTPLVELVDADGKVFGALVSFGGSGYFGPVFFVAAAGQLFAMSQGSMMTPDGSLQTRYENALMGVVWATSDCSGPAYQFPGTPTSVGAPEGWIAQVAQFRDGWHVVRVSAGSADITFASYLDWMGACVAETGGWSTTLNVVEDLGAVPSFRSPLRPRVSYP